MQYSLIHYGTSDIVLNGRKYKFEDFLKVCSDYTIFEEFTTRVYEKGKQHYISDGVNTLHLSKHDSCCDEWCERESQLAHLLLRLKKEKGE